MLTANPDKMNSSVRIFELKPVSGGSATKDTGLIDKKLFTGENKLKAEMDPQTTLWVMSYENGVVPAALKQRFTSFSKLRAFAESYFKKRNVEITEILNA
jgi:hypothetical protein